MGFILILSLLYGVGKCVLWISIVTELILQIYKYIYMYVQYKEEVEVTITYNQVGIFPKIIVTIIFIYIYIYINCNLHCIYCSKCINTSPVFMYTIYI